MKKYIYILSIVLLSLLLVKKTKTGQQYYNLVQIYYSKNQIKPEKINQLDILEQSILAKGAYNMAQHKVIICGITRDNAQDLNVMIRHIELVGNKFKDYAVLLFENDSSDKTKMILANWKILNKKVDIITKDYGNKKRPSIKFLADARNKYIKFIQNNKEYDDFDILMVTDMDMKHGFDVRGLEHSFAFYDKWDAVCANGISNSRGDMYDMFAFWNDEFPIRPNDDKEYWTSTVFKGQKPYLVNSAFVPVYSCFGGLAFYKRQYSNGCKYDSIDGDCEHIPFHTCVRKNGGKIYMNPSQIIRYSHYTN